MIWNLKKFNQEIKHLPELSRQTDPLSLEEQQRIKQAVLLAIAGQPQEQALGLTLKEKWLRVLRVIIPTLLGLSLVGGTAFASTSAKPGDLLYPVKLATEKVRLQLAFSQNSKANLQAEFATERLNELEQLSPPKNSQHNPRSQQLLLTATTSGNLNIFASSTENYHHYNAQDNKQNSLKTQTQNEAGLEVQNALKALQQAKTNSQNQGNNKNAENFDKKIKDLEQQALQQNVPINLPPVSIPTNDDNKNTGTTSPANIENKDQHHKNGVLNIINIQNQASSTLASSTDFELPKGGGDQRSRRHSNPLNPLLHDQN